MKPVIAQAFEAMSKGECPCHRRIQETKPRSSVGIRQAQQQGLVARRGYADPRWPDVPLEYDALVRNIKNTPALFAYRRREDGSWDVDPIRGHERAEKEKSGHRVVQLGAGQVLAVRKSDLAAHLFG